MKRMLLAVTIALSMALGGSTLGVGLTGASGPTHAYADTGSSGLAHFCQWFVGSQYAPPYLTTVGACVSLVTSDFQSNAFAPGFCDFLATVENGGSYPVEVPYIDQNGAFQVAYAANKGQCVSIYAMNGFLPIF